MKKNPSVKRPRKSGGKVATLQASPKASSHGGYRPGAGRKPKSGRPGEKSVVMRIPESDRAAVENLLTARWQLHACLGAEDGGAGALGRRDRRRGRSMVGESMAGESMDRDSMAREAMAREAIAREAIVSAVLPAAVEPPGLSLPLFANRVPAGFPSPADDYVEDMLDLNQQLVKNPAATFFVRVQGNSMTGAGIFDGDTLVVDRAINPRSGNIVVAVVDGELTVKRLSQRKGIIRLLPENPEFAPIEFSEGQELVIWGVVTNVIHPVL